MTKITSTGQQEDVANCKFGPKVAASVHNRLTVMDPNQCVFRATGQRRQAIQQANTLQKHLLHSLQLARSWHW